MHPLGGSDRDVDGYIEDRDLFTDVDVTSISPPPEKRKAQAFILFSNLHPDALADCLLVCGCSTSPSHANSSP